MFNTFRGVVLSMSSRIRVKDCSDGNTIDDNLESCNQKFIGSKMDCKTPWDGNFSNNTRNCSSNEDLKKYFDLRLDMYRGKYKKELDKCSTPKCFENHWSHKPYAKLSGNAFLYQHGKDVKDVQMYHFIGSSKKVNCSVPYTMSGSCHLDRASNVEIGDECQIFVIVIFFNCS